MEGDVLELLLYAARAAEHRNELAEVVGARRQITIEIIEGTGLSDTKNGRLNTEQLAAMLLAMEDGFRLHPLIDPRDTPSDSFLRSITLLQQTLPR